MGINLLKSTHEKTRHTLEELELNFKTEKSAYAKASMQVNMLKIVFVQLSGKLDNLQDEIA